MSESTRNVPAHLAELGWYVPHLEWLSDHSKGKRADLSHANLSGGNLSRANLSGGVSLRGADLRFANLSHANLCGANLKYSRLEGIDLHGAELRGIDLRGATGVVRLDMHDPRDYTPVAIAHADGWRIKSGCRWFTVDEATQHWGPDYDGTREIGDRYMRALAALPPAPKVTGCRKEKSR